MNNQTPLRVPPHDLSAEQSVLGSILLVGNKDQKIREIFDLLRPDMFYKDSHQLIFSAMGEVQGVDMVTVESRLVERGDIDIAGGFAYLGELQRNTPSAANVMHYVDLVINRYEARQIISACNNAAEQKYEGVDNQEVVTCLKSNIDNIDLTAIYEPDSAADMIDGWVGLMEKRVSGDMSAIGVKTGIPKIDEQIGGIGSDWLIVLVGRPSHGKSLVSQLISANISAQLPVLNFQMEMSKQELFDRYIGLLAGINPKRLREGAMSDDEWARAHQVLDSFKKGRSRIHIDDTPGLSIGQIKSRAKSFKKKNGKIGLIKIDYLGLMKKPKAERNDLAIGEITRQLKELSKEIETPILLLVQANRGADSAARLTMSNIKDSSAIEADADLVMFAHREDVANPDTAWKGVIEIVPAKFRHGEFNRSVYLKKSLEYGGRFKCLSDVEAGAIQNEENLKSVGGAFI